MDYYNQLKSYQISKREQKKLYWRWRLLGCMESKTLLIMSFMPMALKISTKMSLETESIEPNDYFQESYLIINEAIEKYDPAKSELSTFIYHMIRWNLCNYSQKFMSPVKYGNKIRRVMKKRGISMNTVYWSDIEDYFNEHKNGNRSDTILEEE